MKTYTKSRHHLSHRMLDEERTQQTRGGRSSFRHDSPRRFVGFDSGWLVPALCVVCLSAVLPASADTNLLFNTIALEGGMAPDGNGLFEHLLSAPAANRSGQVLFHAQPINHVTGSSGPAGLFLLGRSNLSVLVGDPAPDGNGQFSSFSVTIPNDAGQVVFSAGLSNTAGGTTDNAGIFRLDGGGVMKIARENDPAPDGNGVFSGFFFVSGGPVMGALGKVAFPVVMSGTSGGTTDDNGIYMFDGTSLVKVARENDFVPEGNGQFNTFGHPVINRAGQVAIDGGLRNTDNGSTHSSRGMYLFTDGELVKLVRENEPLPDGNGSFGITFAPDINDAGQVAFSAFLINTASNSTLGIYIHNGAAGPEKVIRACEPAPDGNGVFSQFGFPVLNGAGQVAFRAVLRDTSAGIFDNAGIFLWTGSVISQIARKNDLAPDGNGRFSGFSAPFGTGFPPEVALNGAGQVAFFATLRGTSDPFGADRAGIYATDPDGNLRKIVRTGDLFDVDPSDTFVNLRTITGLSLITGSGGQDGRATSFNDRGVLTFQLFFDDNSSGIFSARFSTSRFRHRAEPVSLTSLGGPPPDTNPRPSFQGLGHLAGNFLVGTGSDAFALSGDGLVVGGWSPSPLVPNREAFRWTAATGMIGAGSLAGQAGIFGSHVSGISGHGSVLVGQTDMLFGANAFRWTEATGMVSLGVLPGGGSQSIANAVSANGSVVVGWSESASGDQAFLWRRRVAMVGLGDLPGGEFRSFANAVSADGSVVVGSSSSASGFEAFRWTAAEGMVGLGDLPGGNFNSSASAVSADGSVVVGTSDSAIGSQPFRWTTATGMAGLGFEGSAFAVSADGSVVVGHSNGDAFIWDATNGMRALENVLVDDLNLDLGDFVHLRDATAISDDGRTIAGTGSTNVGPEAWIARLP